MKAKIFQIYYSEDTKYILDPAFIPLDNMRNERPDWREYWPIRNYLLTHKLEDDVMYGFFSPKFNKKTGIEGATAIDFIENLNSEVDVVNFSPFYVQAVFFQNVLEQAYSVHKSGFDNLLKSFSEIFPGASIGSIVNTSIDTIYSNYFVAKKDFWIKWLSVCEEVYKLAEDTESPHYQTLNENVKYGAEGLPFKIFFIERIATLILSSNSYHVSRFPRFDNDECSYFGTKFLPEQHHERLMIVDACKMAFLQTGNSEYMRIFSDLRQSLISEIL